MSYNQRSGGRFRRPTNRFQARGGSRQVRKKFDPSLLVRKAEELVPEEPFAPQHSFADFGFVTQLLKNIEARGYDQPTLIQDKAIAHVMEGRDVIGLANTGTGKTAAFLLPLINKIANDDEQSVLIIAPTRELAVQIEQEFRQFSVHMRQFSALCIGGVNIRPQIQKLQRQPHFVIGTPGRLKDLEQQGALYFEDYTNIVLDEVDQMLDMGFIHDIRYITSKLPKERQTLFFSATMPEAVKSVMQQLVKDPITVSVKSRDTSANVDQDIVKVQGQSKIDVLDDLLRQEGFSKVLVFIRTKHGAEKLQNMLYKRGVSVGAIHGNKSQGQRQRAIEDFKRDYIQVLLATDVASRGLDIDNVSHVINYDLPETYEDYIHRIGRTGRANRKGTALSFID